jgi:hypothetical protein
MVLEKNVENKITDRIRSDEVFQRAKEERLFLKIKKKETPLMDRAYN